MGWLKRLFGVDEPKDTGEQVDIDRRHIIFDPLDRTEVRVLIRVRFRDGREDERHEVVQRNQIEALEQDLIDDVDIREAAIYEEAAYHHKSYAGDYDAQLITIGAVVGATAAAGIGRGV